EVEQDRLLVLPVVVDARRLDPERLRDLADRRRLVALAEEELGSRTLELACSCLLPAGHGPRRVAAPVAAPAAHALASPLRAARSTLPAPLQGSSSTTKNLSGIA